MASSRCVPYLWSPTFAHHCLRMHRLRASDLADRKTTRQHLFDEVDVECGEKSMSGVARPHRVHPRSRTREQALQYNMHPSVVSRLREAWRNLARAEEMPVLQLESQDRIEKGDSALAWWHGRAEMRVRLHGFAQCRELGCPERIEKTVAAAESPEQGGFPNPGRECDRVHRDRLRSVGRREDRVGGGEQLRRRHRWPTPTRCCNSGLRVR